MNANNGGQGNASASFGATYGAPAEPAAPQGAVKDISTAQFVAEVIEVSRQKPVLVDFWAPWCGPCKQLAPALERAVAATRGAVKLVKMNIDEHPEVAGQMGIQSIPAVVAFVDGRPKDAFMGAIGESEIARFLEKLVGSQGPTPIEEALRQAEQMAAGGAPQQAASLYAAVLNDEPGNVEALAGLGQLQLGAGDLDGARARLEAVPPDAGGNPKVASLRAAIELAEQAANLGDRTELAARIERDPKDYDARFDLALAENALGNREAAAEQLMEIIRRDRNWRDDGARTQLLQFFEAWGPADPATAAARRKLSSLLFS